MAGVFFSTLRQNLMEAGKEHHPSLAQHKAADAPLCPLFFWRNSDSSKSAAPRLAPILLDFQQFCETNNLHSTVLLSVVVHVRRMTNDATSHLCARNAVSCNPVQ
jgi:hypothetical protein